MLFRSLTSPAGEFCASWFLPFASMASSKYASSLTKICPLCGFQANLKGFASHERACRTRLEKETASKAFSDQMIIDEGEIVEVFKYK